MSEVYVNRKTTSLDFDASTKNGSSFDALECILTSRDETLDPNPKNVDFITLESMLVDAATSRDLESFRKIVLPLVELGQISRLDSINALHWACYSGFVDLVNILLNSGCDPHYPDDINLETPIYFAIKASNVYIVHLLVERYGIPILCHENRKFMSPFITAASEFVEDNVVETLHILEYLYLAGVSLEEQDGQGRTALMHASRRGSSVVVQWLLSRGANMNHRDHLGNSVLHHACTSGSEDTLMLLCKNGAIKLLHSKAIAATIREQTPLGISLMKRNYLQFAILLIWSFQYNITGRIFSLRSMYPVYYWIISFLNLFFFVKLYGNDLYRGTILDYWIISWIASQCFWFATYVSDPGVARKNLVVSQKDRVSKEFTQESLYPVQKDDLYESMLSELENEQLMVNYNLYKITGESYLLNFWFPHNEFESDLLKEPLNGYYESHAYFENPIKERVQTCRVNAAHIQTEMRALYAHVALDRQSKSTYADHILYRNICVHPDTYRDVYRNICITCNMERASRSHHCGICGNCVIHQDHHCAWVDNCIARNNQRSFFLFLTFLFATFVQTQYIHIVYLYCEKDWHSLYALCILGVDAGNAVLLAFVVYLWARTIRSMVTDVTFYEYLKKPYYIRKKFKNTQGSLWDFSNTSMRSATHNILNFWTSRHY
ncbi:zinc finger protein DHHC domain-containing protein [Theileria equi strain WA]|uniref:Palmitoyltransferase n=1 Tax=Theileria equi strain WA TaxID=1537102 RepID=L0B0S0_THEEQ|nr:zinc finger protein DHHC domain-containing protein [Theileria equi strain WA]AFZ81442.1 zinc finger protein DHHC domain-containing protein [Theileria equi strain WA]|eukprot:XP_004831108.1 zinc finger protein DHHC domain-containing protein [Theileria equi strain WA]